MRKFTKGLLSVLFLLSSIFSFTRAGQAAPTKTGLENKKPDSLILKHQRELKKGDMIALLRGSNSEKANIAWHYSHSSHESHYSHSSHESHYSHYSSRY